MKDLIEKAQKGDELAFKQLTEAIIKDLYRIAKTRLNNEDDINDAIQNTMIITYKNIKRQTDIEFFKTWMIRVLINECNKIYNSNKKHIFIWNKIIANHEATYFDTSIQKINDKLGFETLIKKLSYNEQIIVTLYYNSNYSCEEISKILKMKKNTVKSILLRARKKLKNFYKGENNND